ncbi:MAG: efflux RND transporter periplasmic adaptor subunit [Bacteroidetes bacterium]|nr:efflux RND transporter periplasmic adaptor subunit [Bacteroidota bacterium]
MNKTVRNISVILLIIVVGVLLIVPKLLSDKKESGPGNQNQQNQTLPADAIIVRSGEHENEISTVGTVVANEQVDIKSELSRKITGIYFNEGTFVPAGKLLFKLDDADIVARLNKLRIDEDLNLKQEEREKQLLDKGLFTPDEFEIRQTNIEKIRADIEILEIELSKTYIKSPISGITGFRNVSKGSLVNSAVVLTTVQDIGKVKIDFSIPEKYVSMFSKGMDINFNMDGYSEDFSAKVVSYDPNLNESTRSIILRAVTQNKGSKLLPGSFVKVKLQLEKDVNIMMIPTEALIPKLKGQSVFVFNDGTAVLKDVETGFRSEKEIQITSGISIGDTVLTTNILKLKNNSKVKIDKLN